MGISETQYAAITAEAQLEAAYKLLDSAIHGVQGEEYRKSLLEVRRELAYVISYHARDLHPQVLSGEV